MNGGGGSRAGQRGPAGTHERGAGAEDAVGRPGRARQGRAVPQRGCASGAVCRGGGRAKEAAQPPLVPSPESPQGRNPVGTAGARARGPLQPLGSRLCSRAPAPAITGDQRELNERKRQI